MTLGDAYNGGFLGVLLGETSAVACLKLPNQELPFPLTASPLHRPAVSGTALCLTSALAYTVANLSMRQLSEMHCDPQWAVCCKELFTVVALGALLLWQALRGRPIFPSMPVLCQLVAVGLLIQLVGNLGSQWSLGVVGLAVTIPSIFGLMLTSAAVLGWLMLGERVSRRSAAAISLLLISLVLLGIGAEAVGRSISARDQVTYDPLLVALAIAAACMAGAVYSLLSIATRHAVRQAAPPATVAFLVTLMGVVSLGPLSLATVGPRQMLATPPEQAAMMAVAGFFNLVGFFALILALQRTTVVHANVLNASQVALAGLGGMLLFSEPPNRWLLLGIGLTIVGIISIDRPAGGEQPLDQHI